IEIGTGRVILEGVTSEAALDADDFVLSGIVDTVPGGGGDTMPGGGDDTMPGGGDPGPPEITGTPGPDVLTGTTDDERVLGLAGADLIGTSGGTDTLIGGSGADIFAILLNGGALDGDPDLVDDFSYLGGDQVGLGEALAARPVDDLTDLVRATVSGSDTLIEINLGDGFDTALRLLGVNFTTAQLLSYGFDAPTLGSAAFVENPYGFTNTSTTTTDPFATPDGRYVAFVDKQNLDNLAGDITPIREEDEFGGFDTNEDSATMDIFVRNMATGAVQRASVMGDGTAIETGSGAPATANSPVLTDDGRFVFFVTNGQASGADTNDSGDVYMRDLLADTAPVLVSLNGTSAAGGVPVGLNFTTTSVSVLDASADGRRIAYVTDAAIDAANDTNGDRDVYLHDLDTGLTTLVSARHNLTTDTDSPAGGGVANPYSFGIDDSYKGDPVHISADGRYVAYVTDNSHINTSGANLDPDGSFDLYLRDTLLERTLLVTDGFDSNDVQDFDMSADGARIVYATRNAVDSDDRNDEIDVYLAKIDLAAFTVSDRSRISELEGGFELKGGRSYSPTISADGTRALFLTDATDIAPVDPFSSIADRTDIVEVDLTTGALTTTANSHRLDDGSGNEFSNKAFALTEDAIVYRKSLGGDTIEVSAPVDFPNIDVPGDTSGLLRLSSFGGSSHVTSSIDGLFDTDVYFLGSSPNLISVSVEGTGGAGGTLPDPSIQIRTGSQTGPVTASDNNSGFGDDAFLVHRLTGGVDNYLIVRSGTFAETGSYRVSVDVGFPRSGPDTPIILDLDTPFSSRLFSSTNSDYYKFDADGGTRYEVNVTPEGVSDPLDGSIIRVRNANDQVLANSSVGADTLDFIAPEDGLLFIEVDVTSASSGNPGFYSVEIEEDPLIIIFPPPIFPPPIFPPPIFPLGTAPELPEGPLVGLDTDFVL
ncbi:MAG: hypothetical protein AAF367_11705, partial [Pseudomonadota bacterium]